jgi:hypothetical protein
MCDTLEYSVKTRDKTFEERIEGHNLLFFSLEWCSIIMRVTNTPLIIPFTKSKGHKCNFVNINFWTNLVRRREDRTVMFRQKTSQQEKCQCVFLSPFFLFSRISEWMDEWVNRIPNELQGMSDWMNSLMLNTWWGGRVLDRDRERCYSWGLCLEQMCGHFTFMPKWHWQFLPSFLGCQWRKVCVGTITLWDMIVDQLVVVQIHFLIELQGCYFICPNSKGTRVTSLSLRMFW